jgi:hypothetical protein
LRSSPLLPPSRDDGRTAHAYNSYVFPLLSSWLKAGYAVVRTGDRVDLTALALARGGA